MHSEGPLHLIKSQSEFFFCFCFFGVKATPRLRPFFFIVNFQSKFRPVFLCLWGHRPPFSMISLSLSLLIQFVYLGLKCSL